MSVPAIPPYWAEPVLRALLPSGRADDMTGDLLEALRAEPCASQRVLFADVWYGRHVASLFLRTYWLFPAVLTATLKRERGRYAKNEPAARAFLSAGESPRNAGLAPAEHAAWAQVAVLVLNLSETVTRN